MRLKGFLVFLLSLFCTYSSFAQPKGELTQSRILILLDESSSMIQKWPSGKEKYKAADELIMRLMDSIYAINSQVEFSLRVFGHQYTVEQNNCYDTKNEVPFSKDNRTQMSLRLDDIHPLGVTPIAYALMQAAKYDLVDEDHNAYSIILITDGGESCGGDICDVMKKLMKYKVYFKPYIVSLEDDPSLKVTYSCMGDYLQVTKDADMPKAVSTIVTAFRPLLKITKSDYKEIQTIAANAPSVLKVTIPEIKVSESDIKKVIPETPVPKPVKTFIDTTVAPIATKPKDTAAKPVTKIKVDLPPAKLPSENIARLPLNSYKPLYTAISAPKPPKEATLPAVDIVAPATSDNIDMMPLAQAKPFAVPAPTLKGINPANMPAVNIVAPATSDNIDVLPLAQARPFAVPAPTLKGINQVNMPAVDIVVPNEQEHMQGMALARPKLLNTTSQIAQNISPVRLPSIDIKIPVTLTEESTDHLTPAQPTALATGSPKLKNPNPVQADMKLPPVVVDTPTAPKNKIEKLARLQLAAARRIQILIVIEEKSIVPVKMPPLPPLKIDLPKVAVKAPEKDVPGQPKEAKYTVEVEDAKETTVEVYLTDGKGKFYNSTPQMLLLDPATKSIVKTFYRTVDAGGNPDPITTLPTGTFNISLSARRSLEVSNVKIEPNKKTKIKVIVHPCTLSFEYAKAPNRPVSEFMARVIERNKTQGRVQDQKCTERLEYEPGNYHIMINTFPQIDRNEDIDFNEAVITIPQPGFGKFITEGSIKTVDLYKQEGDRFLYFSTLNLGDPINQHRSIQPGAYQVHFKKVPAIPGAQEQVITFYIKATEVQTIEIK